MTGFAIGWNQSQWAQDRLSTNSQKQSIFLPTQTTKTPAGIRDGRRQFCFVGEVGIGRRRPRIFEVLGKISTDFFDFREPQYIWLASQICHN
jgi:hypothetical protein